MGARDRLPRRAAEPGRKRLSRKCWAASAVGKRLGLLSSPPMTLIRMGLLWSADESDLSSSAVAEAGLGLLHRAGFRLAIPRKPETSANIQSTKISCSRAEVSATVVISFFPEK